MWSLTLTIPHSVSVNLVCESLHPNLHFFRQHSLAAKNFHSAALDIINSLIVAQAAMQKAWLTSMFTADPQAIADNDNVFGLLPVNTGLKIAVWLMVIHQVPFIQTCFICPFHQCNLRESAISQDALLAILRPDSLLQFVAFALYTIPTLYMFEKLCGKSSSLSCNSSHSVLHVMAEIKRIQRQTGVCATWSHSKDRCNTTSQCLAGVHERSMLIRIPVRLPIGIRRF